MSHYTFDDDPDEDHHEDNSLNTPEEALQLIAQVYSWDRGAHQQSYQQQRRLKRLRLRMMGPLLGAMMRIPLPDMDVYGRMQVLHAKIVEQTRFSHLTGKTVIGVGGKFSAGKSFFLNSLTGCSNLLPTGQAATTSIPTYIVHGEKRDAFAYILAGKLLPLDQRAMHALTHAFHDRFRIGFAKAIDKIILSLPSFAYRNIALLDTPGYNKADPASTATVGFETEYEAAINSQDARIAREHLQNCDCLLWLVDVTDGVIHETDIRFLQSLNRQLSCLVVFTKADKKDEEAVREIMDGSEQVLRSCDLPIMGVTAFSSLRGEEYFGNNCIATFLEEASTSTRAQEDVIVQFDELIKDWSTVIHQYWQSIQNQNSVLLRLIRQLWDPRIRSLVMLQQEVVYQKDQLFWTEKNVMEHAEAIHHDIMELLQGNH